MSVKWTNSHSESGILRKSEFKEKKEELFVFGYSCKLFRDDDKALQIDQGKHLIPWMADESLKIDRYDARGALHDLSVHEAPPGGFDWRVELTRGELDVEQLCDEERYRALHTDEDEEEMYKEEELKRLHAAGYGQVGFNYDTPAPAEPVAPTNEVDEPFVPTPAFKALLPDNVLLPESEKLNVIIEKTAKFIASQGAQMEILIKAKQRDNPQFQFLNRESELHPYYTALIALVKAGKWPEKAPEVVEEKPPENEEYLHPSLASNVIELAPSIPSIHYKPSADCDYTMLISKMRGEPPPEETYSPELAPGEVAPPGTEPLPPRSNAEISRAPVMYPRAPDPATQAAQLAAQSYSQLPAHRPHPPHPPQPPPPAPKPEPKAPFKSTGLSLMKNYNTDSDSDVSDCDDTSSTDSKGPVIVQPPLDVQQVIDKMAAYVARNGAEFADIVRAKGDPRFAFLEPNNEHHAYYCSRLAQLRIGENEAKAKAPVSFSIKKLKEPDPILPKPALPYESSSEDETENTDKQPEKEDTVKTNVPPVVVTNNVAPVVVYKMDGIENNLPTVKTIETAKPKVIQIATVNPEPIVKDEKPVPIVEPKPAQKIAPKIEEIKKPEVKRLSPEIKKSPEKKVDKKHKERDSSRIDKKEKSKKRDRHENREKRSDRDKKREVKERDHKKKYSKEELESEIISLEDNSDEMIDLTGDHSDTKDGDECERAKQLERRRRAAEFLKKVGVDPAAAALPTSSLASAMVDTLESLRKKKAEAEEKRRKREKRRHRDKYGYEDDADRSHRKSKRRKYNRSSDEEDSDYDSSRKKKRRKEKKSSKSKKKKKREPEEDEEKVDHPLPPNMDLNSTLKELRTSSPTKELVQEALVEESQYKRESSSEDEDRKRKKKKDREYSEGEWSSDSEADSRSTPSKNGD